MAPAWYRPIEPFIQPKVQIVAANSLLYISTARGLYAIRADNGNIQWVYPTELPLGHSPTIHNGVAYVGGLDHKIHAVQADPDPSTLPADPQTGYRINDRMLWTFEARADGVGAGFHTNPLAAELDIDGNGDLETMVYAGNRDGYMYAIRDDGDRGSLVWTYQTQGPILFSAAYHGERVYFASNDSYAYCLDARTGQQIWKSAKLPSHGFHSWWPVIVEDVVIFPASRGYRVRTPPQTDWESISYTKFDVGYALPMGPRLPDGTMSTVNAVEYLENVPWRRSYYILDLDSGQEITFDVDADSKPEYAPLMNFGTNSGNRYPPLIGPDNTIYTANMFSDIRYQNGIAGWTLGTAAITTPGEWLSVGDEPLGYAAGGNVIYWNQCCDRSGGAFDMSGSESWTYFSYDLNTRCPGYDVMTMGTYLDNLVRVYGGWNGVYGYHGDQSPPIPYNGKVYMHRSNAIIAWSSTGGGQALPLAQTVETEDPPAPVAFQAVSQRLAAEIQKVIDAGHLRPGYGAEGDFSVHGRHAVGDNLTDYWHNPLDTILTLTLAMPHIPADLQQELEAYIQDEYSRYRPYLYTHVGWREGAAREAFDLPPEVEDDLSNWPATMWSTYDFEGWAGPDWRWTPHTFYALWKYAQSFGNARAVFDSSKYRLWTPPSNDVLAEYPFAHNAYIAGYLGYLELEKLAGYPESVDVRAELDRLLSLRVSSFAKDNPWGPNSWDANQAFSVARNFVFLVPELGEYLRENALGRIQKAVAEYEDVAPYWFLTRFEATYGENVMHHLYDYAGLFAAKALILKEPGEELIKYLDVPAFQRGDLFYIQNLVAILESERLFAKTASSRSGEQGSPVKYTLRFFGTGNTLTLTDTLSTGVSAPVSFEVEGTSVPPSYDGAGHHITWSDSPPEGQRLTISYTVTIVTGDPQILVNHAELRDPRFPFGAATAMVFANPWKHYLPLVLRHR